MAPRADDEEKEILHESLEKERHRTEGRRRSIGIYYLRELARTFFLLVEHQRGLLGGVQLETAAVRYLGGTWHSPEVPGQRKLCVTVRSAWLCLALRPPEGRYTTLVRDHGQARML